MQAPAIPAPRGTTARRACSLPGNVRACSASLARGPLQRFGSGDAATRSLSSTRWPSADARSARRAACRNWRSQADLRLRRTPYSGSPSTGWPMAARCTRIWCVRPVSSFRRSRLASGRAARSSSKWVTAGRSARPPTAMRPTSLRSRPIGASIVPRRDGGRPRTSAMYSRSISRCAHLLAQRRVGLVAARRARAGRRCRGRAGGRRPGAARRRRRARPRLRSGGAPASARPPRRRVRDDAGGLVGHDHVLVDQGERDLELDAGLGPGRRALGLVLELDQLAAGQAQRLVRRRAVDAHARRARSAARRRRASGSPACSAR